MLNRYDGNRQSNAVIGKQEARTLTDISFAPPPESGTWITDYAWVSGLAGAVMVVLLAGFYRYIDALDKGVVIGGLKLAGTRIDALLLALGTIAGVMLIVEAVRLWMRDRHNFFNIHPDLKKGRYGAFFGDALANWLLYLCLLCIAILFFKSANEYGFARQNNYYQTWFRFLELALPAYIWVGLPYVLITRAVKYDALADRRDFSALTARILAYLGSYLPGLKKIRPEFNEIDKKATRALLVKLFFTPLMTVFFADQFPHLVNNIGFVAGAIGGLLSGAGLAMGQFNRDLFNVGISFIFSIDVALAWCGYVVSSRWVDNQTITAEPTILGWLVCLACYPPFQRVLGVYYSPASERAILEIPHQWIVTIFAAMMVLSYFVYMSATLWFGVRFSNLTNRGIIRKGPYAFIRHPAYASKNFSWWCVMFPAAIYNGFSHNAGMAAVQILGLIFMTGFYYLRAITEERHLMADPYYQAYCKLVPYRFIPGVI